MVLVGYATSSCSSASKDKEQNDSIAAAEREAARLDSIRQDSIARRNFTSPDLKFHDLHGDVKKCVVDNNEYTTYTFDENGKWTNEPQWDEYDKKFCPDRTKHPRVIRNKDGYITRIYCECDADDEYEAFSWEGGKVIGEGANIEDEHGFSIYDEFEGWDGKDPSTQTVYYDYIVDDMGNWIQRSYFLKSWDPDYPDFTTYFYERTQTRTITYYKKISQNRTALPNSSFQKQKLQALKASKQKKEQEDKKGPEWINGIWEVNTTVSTAMGSMRVNAKVCIDRKSQQLAATDCGSTVARGIYRISGNSIHCGDLYIEMDMSNERLEYGNGVYYRKVSDKYL